MTSKRQPLSITDRLERIPGAASLRRDDLEDLASYADDLTGWANELDTRMADFAAEVEMYYNPGTPRWERAKIRERLQLRAEETAGALRAISEYCEPPLVPATGPR